mmetsp:Transcript_13782/g.20526  ORF Transcript_13782/g.20526 Transcript_13782/m.20526 type:complete len:547 (-) Transcript_13782:232-1872(-)
MSEEHDGGKSEEPVTTTTTSEAPNSKTIEIDASPPPLPTSGSKDDKVTNNNGVNVQSNNGQGYSQFAATAAPTAPLSPSYPHQSHFNRQQYYYQTQHTPNSPATPNLMNGYDVQSLLGQQQQQQQQQMRYPAIPPLSPGDANLGLSVDDVNLSMGAIPPASPLFPGASIPVFGTGVSEQLDNSRSMGSMSMVTPSSPGLQYLTGPPPSPVVSYGGMYSSNLTPGSPEAHSSWNDRSLQQQHMYPPGTPTASPHMQSSPYQSMQSRRSASFDGGELLPPSALDDNGAGVYATSGAGGATLFSQQQPWSYSPNTSPYGNGVGVGVIPPGTSLQHQQGMRSPPRGRQFRGDPSALGVAAAPYFPAATPGPPIQTTHHNKGPEGANLFIFHIPNHFTNLDMWHLFCRYGNLLSVRIMVEKETGRSRGFGFVSYDAPEAAALAIKELNGFVIGNKRLKVQHKQIRQGEQQSPPLFPEGSPVGQPHPLMPGEIVPPGHPQQLQMHHDPNLSAIEVTVNGPNVTGGGGGVKGAESSILNNLEAIGEALPEVSN